MTPIEIALICAAYLAAWIAVAYFTRARFRRIAGSAVGGAVFGVVGLLAVVLGESEGWWRVPIVGNPFRIWLALAISCVPVYLITWRVARRFGARGLAVCIAASAAIGPPRDYAVAAAFPRWILFAPGIAPILADAVFYALLVAVGHTAQILADRTLLRSVNLVHETIVLDDDAVGHRPERGDIRPLSPEG